MLNSFGCLQFFPPKSVLCIVDWQVILVLYFASLEKKREGGGWQLASSIEDNKCFNPLIVVTFQLKCEIYV